MERVIIVLPAPPRLRACTALIVRGRARYPPHQVATVTTPRVGRSTPSDACACFAEMRRSYGKSCKNENARWVPSDYPEFARFLVRCGIDSLSLNPDTVLKTIIIWNRSRINSP